MTESKPEIVSFLEKFPRWMRDPLCAVCEGQMATVRSFEAYEETHGDSLTTGQHPHYAYAGDSNPEGATKFLMGSGLLGETLSYRVPGGLWFDSNGKTTFRARAFMALVALKHIDTIVMATNTKSDLIGILCEKEKRGEDFLSELPPAAKEAARSYGFLLEDVRKKGFDFYEKEYGLTLKGSDEDKLKQALAVEIGFRNLGAARKEAGAPGVVFVLQIPEEQAYHQWNPETGRFVSVAPPVYENDPRSDDQRRAEVSAYLAAFPEKQQEYNVKIANGLSRLIVAMADHVGRVEAVHLASSSCSDSRTAKSTVAGALPPLEGTVLRTPGILWTEPNGSLGPEAALFLAFAAMRGEVVTKANEATCGAMTAIYLHNADPEGEGKGLPPAFKELGEAYADLYRAVVRNGVDYYAEQGVNIRCYGEASSARANEIIACLAVEQLWRDVVAGTKEPHAPPIVGVMQNLPEERNYALDLSRGQFCPLPRSADASGPTRGVVPGGKGRNPALKQG